MEKFTIEVRRVENIEFEVEAENYEEAREKALDRAYNTDFHECADNAWYMTPDEDGTWVED